MSEQIRIRTDLALEARNSVSEDATVIKGIKVVEERDAENDITMIEAAGIGAVMKNANDDIKQHGDYITERNNNEGGVAEVIQKFMLSDC